MGLALGDTKVSTAAPATQGHGRKTEPRLYIVTILEGRCEQDGGGDVFLAQRAVPMTWEEHPSLEEPGGGLLHGSEQGRQACGQARSD